jgi:hypothetical protein
VFKISLKLYHHQNVTQNITSSLQNDYIVFYT